MFYRDHESWKYYSAERGNWVGTSLKNFDQKLLKLAENAGSSTSGSATMLPAGAMPAFSGSKIICVGRNYRKHAAELGNDVPTRPLWFSKPPSSIIGEGGTVVLPGGVGRIDYEGELALIISKWGRNLSVAEAPGVIGGVTACLDMTARELQQSDGQWTRAKGFDTFLPLASLVAPFSDEWQHGSICVYKNGEMVQNSSFEAMVFGFAELVADISACMTLEPGDLILTGTPEGVGPVVDGDRLKVCISGPAVIELNVCCRGN